MLQQKREMFRVQIRNQNNQNIFKQKRQGIITTEYFDSTFEQLINLIETPRIITQDYLKELNQCLLDQIRKKIDEEKKKRIESSINHLIPILLYQILEKDNFISETLTIFINLTYLSDIITEILVNTNIQGLNIISLISQKLEQKYEINTCLELLINLWYNPCSHKIEQFNLLLNIDSIVDESIQYQNNLQIISISKCFKNLLFSISEEQSIIDCEWLLLIIKKLLSYIIQQSEITVKFNLQYQLNDILESYIQLVKLYNFKYIKNDLSILENLLLINKTDLIQQTCSLFSHLYINEPQEFITYLINKTIVFSKKILKLQLNHYTPDILNMISILFTQQTDIQFNHIQPFFDDVSIIDDIIRLTEDCQMKKIRESSIRCIKILVDNSNELQIQELVQMNLYFILIDLLKDCNTLGSDEILYILQSINRLLQYFSIQTFQIDYPEILQSLALHKNKDINIEANHILDQFEQFYN